MIKREYSFEAEVWIWPGVGALHFVNVPDKISKEIRSGVGKGMLKVLATLRKTSWNTALFPYKNPKGNFGYLICIKKNIRNKEKIFDRDKIKVSFKIL